MIASDWIDTAKAKLTALADKLEAIFDTHPEIAGLVADGATDLVADARTVATTEVEKVAPAEAPTIDSIIAAASAAIDAKLASDVAALNAEADAKKAALATAQTTLQATQGTPACGRSPRATVSF